jgi:predicted DNA-binding transcriptional regulator AlpA
VGQLFRSVLAALGSLGVSPEDLVSISGIAEMFGIAAMTAHRYTERPAFPEPLGRAGGGRVWLRQDVDAWGKAHLPLPTGRPRKREGEPT